MESTPTLTTDPVAASELERWRRVPKVELHLHLDTSISFEVACQLEPTMTQERFLAEFQAPPRVGSLSNFLERAFRQVTMLQTRRALRLVTEDVVAQLGADGVVYAELRFAPLLHTEGDMTAAEAVDTVVTAAHRAGKRHGVELGFILCALRHFTETQSMNTAELVDNFAQRGLPVGFDLAGDEIGFPLDAHLGAFEFVIQRGRPFTVHAGEAGGPESVVEVLDALRPSRIGHGVRSIQDPALVQRLAADGVHLETCPTCNVQTEIVATYADHAIDELRRAGVDVGVSTDQRTITPITLSEEYALLHRHFGWTVDDFTEINRSTMAVTFAGAGTKRRITAGLGRRTR